QDVATGSTVTLDGSGSFDANGDTITYSWAFTSRPDNSTATLSDASAADPTFFADLDGSYVLNLIVNDGLADSDPDKVTITATTPNSPPIADAGADQSVSTNTTVTLNGSGSSDPDDADSLTYNWTFSSKPIGSTATLSDASAANPTFFADLDGSYVLSLVVNDGKVNSASDAVIITAATPNSPPVADAGVDQSVSTGATVTLDGSGSSDPDDADSLTYKWTFTSKPIGSTAALSDATTEKPTFTADLDGSYILNLVVNDGSVDSAADAVIISAATPNSPPVADAGADQSVSTGATVTLDGSGSSDPNNDPLTYNWTFTSKPIGSTAALSDATTEKPTFTADLDGSYILSLVVNDGSVDSAADSVIITAATPNSPPIADAGADQSVATNTTVTLDGSGSFDPDADPDPLTYNWTFTSKPIGSAATLSDATAENPIFTADLDGSYILSLVVNDGSDDSTADEVIITASNLPPVAEAGPTQNVKIGDPVTLDGSRSYDPNDDPLTYSWSFIEGGVGVTLTGGTTATPSFTAINAGTYILELIVNDGTLDSDPDSVTINSR
ncbi:MAG: hypothetical protein C0619_09995, partial [Desulfuromonas sp.]